MEGVETLSIPPEPMEIKMQIHEDMKHLGSEYNSINSDPLALWYGNKIPSYLWKTCGWRNVLGNKGYTWQKFLKKMKYRTEDALLWIKGNSTWEEFTKKILDSLEN